MKIRRSQFLLAALALAAFLWLFNYLSTGSIKVSSAKGSSIAIQSISEGFPIVKTGFGSLSATVGHGHYLATVKNGSQTSTQIINFTHGHRSFQYVIGLSPLKAASPVASAEASNMVIGRDRLVYLDSGSGRLSQIDTQNHSAQLGDKTFQSVKWADPAFGVGQDSAGALYRVEAGAATALKLPFAYDSNQVSYDVSASRQIYVAHGADVYWGDSNGNFKKMYTAPSQPLMLAGAQNKVAIAPSADQTDGSNWVTVATPGKNTKKQFDAPAKRLAWSPDGDQLAIVGDLSVGIYDSTLHERLFIPTAALAAPKENFVGYASWVSDNRILYSASNQVWSFDISTGGGTLLLNIPPSSAINGLAVDENSSFAYITMGAETQTENTISRIGLQGQPAPIYLNQFSSLFPTRDKDYALDLVDFVDPATVIVRPSPDGDLPPGQMLQAAQNQIRQTGLDPGIFRYDVRNSQ